MWFILNPLHHLNAVRAWCDEEGASMHLDAATWRLQVSWRSQSLEFLPRFVQRRESGLVYVDKFTSGYGFAGWHLPGARLWPLALDKVLFKQTALALGLRVPPGWNDSTALANSFVIKPRAGSFGAGIRGPYRTAEAHQSHQIEAGWFREAFVLGRSVKAWVWRGVPTALEVVEPPCLVGDGQRSLGQLVEARRGNMDVRLKIDWHQDWFRWLGVDSGTVLGPGQHLPLDFRYASDFASQDSSNRDRWGSQSSALREQVSRAAYLLWQEVAAPSRERALFTLDGVLDPDGYVWWLEVNSHPMIHPATYPHVLDSWAANHFSACAVGK